MFPLDPTDIFKAKFLGDRAYLIGNITPQITVLGTPREIEYYCKNQIELYMESGDYMLCSFCILPDNIPVLNLRAMKEAVMNYGFYYA